MTGRLTWIKNIDTTLSNHVLKAMVLLQLGYGSHYVDDVNLSRSDVLILAGF
jgi:hypothetical protein